MTATMSDQHQPTTRPINVASTRTLTTKEMSALTGAPVTSVNEWVRTGVIPAGYYFASSGGRTYQYSPRALAVGILKLELDGIFGANSRLPGDITRAVAGQLDRVWNGATATMQVKLNDVEMTIPLRFLQTTRAKLAELDAV